ncbi:MAG: type II secretion system F family protein [Pirellulaceae bacterium]|nr:type II secretion system F family protein [Pirellulaceae bacterium]
MPEFAYTARDFSGKKITGTLTANTEREVAVQLGAKSLFPVTIAAGKGNSHTVATGRVGGAKMAAFYSQLGTLLRSGVPMLRALTVLSQQSGNKTLQVALTDVKARVEEGEALGDAFGRYPRIFNDMAVNMVRAGSEGGFLEDALDRVAVFVELQEELKGKTIGALAYPLFITGVGSIIVSVLLVYFVPKFDPLFNTMRERGNLPAATEVLLAVSRVAQSYWWAVLGVLAAITIFIYQYLKTEKGKRRFDLIKIKTPLLGSVFLNLAVSRFCRVLGTLLANGVPLLKSMDISRMAAGNRILAESIAQAADEVTAGARLAKPLDSCGHFPKTVVEMISVAEESNTLDTVLVQISENLEKLTFRRLDVVVRLLEPIMLLILASIVMFVVLALMVPVLNSSSTF